MKFVLRGYCQRHYSQYKRYGKILNRTIHDLNEIVIYEDYAEIVLYNKQCEEVGRALIDIEDVDKVSKYKWCLRNGYVYNNKVGKLHRYLINPSDDEVVDHKDNNKLDNRKDNLRICSQQQNLMNKSKRRGSCSSQYKGVCWSRCAKKWHARIQINGKPKSLGCYTDELTASIVYDKAAILYHGVYCKLNHPIENYTDYIINDLGLDPNDFNK